jgi:hypothetical protein
MCRPRPDSRSYSSRPSSNTARAFSDRACCCQAYCTVRSIDTSVVGVAMCTRRLSAYSSRVGSYSRAGARNASPGTNITTNSGVSGSIDQ